MLYVKMATCQTGEDHYCNSGISVMEKKLTIFSSELRFHLQEEIHAWYCKPVQKLMAESHGVMGIYDHIVKLHQNIYVSTHTLLLLSALVKEVYYLCSRKEPYTYSYTSNPNETHWVTIKLKGTGKQMT